MKQLNFQKGFATLFIAILILAVMFGIAISLTVLVLSQKIISENITKSNQAYYIAEAGIEDALLRLVKKKKFQTSYNLSVGNGTSNIVISDIIGGSRTITSTGNFSNRIRKIQIVYAVSAEKVSFYYGAQIGEGGVEMQDTSKVEGNVFSNGSVRRLDSNPEITGTVKIAKTGNVLEGMKIGGDVFVDKCISSQITGMLTTRLNEGCTAVGGIEELSGEIPAGTLPISDAIINQWKEEASKGGIISGDYIFDGKNKAFLGPIKIEGNLTVKGGVKSESLFVTGTIWVTGEILVEDQGKIFLDPATYSSLSGLIISDQKITVKNSGTVGGTGQLGSYLMLISTFGNRVSGDLAIVIQDTPKVDILYAHNGQINVQDSIRIRQISGWGLKLQNKARVIYEVGLEDTSFSSGPGGSWEVVDWKEIE